MRGFTIMAPPALTERVVEAEAALDASPDDQGLLEALLQADEALLKAQAKALDAKLAGIPKPFGPDYPALPCASKWRRQASPDMRAYGEAVLKGIRTLQRSALAGETPAARTPNCASGTAHNTGEAILKALRQKAAADCARPAPLRPMAEIEAAYEAAMKAKREALATAKRATSEALAKAAKPRRAFATA